MRVFFLLAWRKYHDFPRSSYMKLSYSIILSEQKAKEQFHIYIEIVGNRIFSSWENLKVKNWFLYSALDPRETHIKYFCLGCWWNFYFILPCGFFLFVFWFLAPAIILFFDYITKSKITFDFCWKKDGLASSNSKILIKSTYAKHTLWENLKWWHIPQRQNVS